MKPRIAELIAALPEDLDRMEGVSVDETWHRLMDDLAWRPAPTGRLRRFWALGTLQAKIAAAYLAYWLRAGYADADEKRRRLNETHLKAALKLLGGMGYLRGAVMKMGQILANYPDVVPEQFADMLGRLHFEAPPMHFSLLRESFRNELGKDPEEVFDDFETKAFAAASLGQVHRARLKGSGQRVAIKVQYPGIARTIHDDFRNMKAAAFPMRLGGDWDNLKLQFDDIRRMLDLETDYEQEAENQRIARLAFREGDGVVVPRVYPEYSTRRVLTMEYLDGTHLGAFMASRPSQELRDRHGTQITLTSFRLWYQAKMVYADPHPGNYLFMPDGRLGLIDFGCCHHFTDQDWDFVCEVDRVANTSEEGLRRVLIRAADMTPKQQTETQRMKLMREWCDWVWEPLFHEGPFDFSDSDYFHRGVALYGELVRRRYTRSLPVNIWLSKAFFGIRAMLAHLAARVDMGAQWEQERATH
jgi:predicted unusual protein kinase regulating ubiquinone biosynthesis (AarF/ABC1/UbiB family)